MYVVFGLSVHYTFYKSTGIQKICNFFYNLFDKYESSFTQTIKLLNLHSRKKAMNNKLSASD